MLLQLALTAAPSLLSASRPSIVHIIADDYGWNDVGFHNKDMHTPAIDQLAASGVVLDTFYVYKYCSPTRSQINTGRYPYHNGFWHNNCPVAQLEGLPLKFVTIAEELQSVGYSTHAVGKWHQGQASDAYTPTRRGFQTFLGYYQGMEDHWSHAIHVRGSSLNPAGLLGIDIHNDTQGQPIVPPGDLHTSPWNCTHSSVLYGGEAARIIHQHDASTPMYLYLALQSAHCPDQAPQNLIDKFSEVVHYGRRVMCGMVVTLDNAVGEVVAALKKQGLFENTLIIFHSDNGGELNNAGSNLPWRGGKFTYWEGGTRVNSFASGGVIPASARGTHYDGLLALVDWFPTVCHLAGIKTIKSNLTEGVPPLDGVDIFEAITTGAPSPRQEHIYNVDCARPQSAKTCAEAGQSPIGAIRDAAGLKLVIGDPGPPGKSAIEQIPSWKVDPEEMSLLQWAGYCNMHNQGSCANTNTTIDRHGEQCTASQPCLFDLSKDITESHNIATQRPADTARLLQRFKELAATQFRMVNTTEDTAGLENVVKSTGFFMPFVPEQEASLLAEEEQSNTSKDAPGPLSAGGSPKPWVNSTDGIHLFLTFDYDLNQSQIKQVGKRYDYVWGSSQATKSPSEVSFWRQGNPDAVISWYITYNRDPHPYNLSWYEQNHPTWVLYQCDGTTPAWEFGQEKPGSVPVNIFDPEVLAWQLSYIDERNEEIGRWMDAIAWDNFGLSNGLACGVKDHNGTFHRLWTGTSDPKYAAGVVEWSKKMGAALHTRGLKMIPNYSLAGRNWTSPEVLTIGNVTDGILDEAGFTFAKGYAGAGGKINNPFVSFDDWKNIIQFMLNLQRHGKGYYSINEYGGLISPPSVDYRYEMTANISKVVRQYVIAAYLMGKAGSAGMELCCTQCYGVALWFDEYAADVGHPLGDPTFATTASEITQRSYSNALVLANAYNPGHPEHGVPITVQLPSRSNGYVDLYGAHYSKSIVLQPQSGAVLLFKNDSSVQNERLETP